MDNKNRYTNKSTDRTNLTPKVLTSMFKNHLKSRKFIMNLTICIYQVLISVYNLRQNS